MPSEHALSIRVDPVFGSIEAIMGFGQFLWRGVESGRGEWSLAAWPGI